MNEKEMEEEVTEVREEEWAVGELEEEEKNDENVNINKG